MKWFLSIAIIGMLAAVYKAKAAVEQYKHRSNELLVSIVRERELRFWVRTACIYSVIVLAWSLIYLYPDVPDSVPDEWLLLHFLAQDAAALLAIALVAAAVASQKPAKMVVPITFMALIMAWITASFILVLLWDVVYNTLASLILFIVSVVKVFL